MSKLFLYYLSLPSSSAATLWNSPYSMLLECTLLLLIDPTELLLTASPSRTSPSPSPSRSDYSPFPSAFRPFRFCTCSVTNIGSSSSSTSSSSICIGGGLTSDSEEKRSSSLGSSRPKSASFFFLKTLPSTFTSFSNLMGGRSGFLALRQQGLRSSMMTSAPVRAQTSISSPLYWLLEAKGLPVMTSRFSEMKLRAQMRLCWFSTLLQEKSSQTSVEKLPAASFSVWMPRILLRATEMLSMRGRVARLAQKLEALQSERKLLPSRLMRLRRRKLSRASGSSASSLKARSRAIRHGMRVSWGMQVKARKLKDRFSSCRHSNPPCYRFTSRIWL